MLPKVKTQLPSGYKFLANRPPSDPITGRFSFSYLDGPIAPKLLEDGATTDNGVYQFLLRNAVLSVFHLGAYQDDNFCWSFASTSQRIVLAALQIGQTLDVKLDPPLERAFHVTKFHFPSGVPGCGYGTYAFHLAVDGLTENGFRIVSSFEPQSKVTKSRIPFFIGFKVFGRSAGDVEYPVWRELLGEAVRYAGAQNWPHALLHAAFALESFIDYRVQKKLSGANMGSAYVNHVLRIAEKKYELLALNADGPRISNSQVNKLYERLNKHIFTPRNTLAHGKTMGHKVTASEASQAIRTAVEFIWDWDKSSRPFLLTTIRLSAPEGLRDTQIVDSSRCEGCEPLLLRS